MLQQGLPLHLGIRQRLHHWEALGADKTLLQVLKHGVKSPLQQVPGPLNKPTKPEEFEKLQEIIQEYVTKEP